MNREGVTGTMEKTCYALRLSARIIDLMMIGLLLLLVERASEGVSLNPIAVFLLYGIVVAVLDGQSLGKYLFSLKIQTNRVGFAHRFARVVREPLFLILSPILFLNLLVISPLPLHDRIAGTKVVRHDI